MKKRKEYKPVRFEAAVVRQAFERFSKLSGKPTSMKLQSVSHDDGARWDYDEVDEFFADYRRFPQSVHFHHSTDRDWFEFRTYGSSAEVSVNLRDRTSIERVFEIFEDAVHNSVVEAERPKPLKIFIGHGRNEQWKLLRDHLRDLHKMEVVAYETGARAGHTIRDILEEMAGDSTFAVLVFTGEDEQADGQMRARQNVVHEAGLFQGTLGFSRAVILLEDGVENLSNVDGIQYIPFSRENIREAFGDVVATIRRESAA